MTAPDLIAQAMILTLILVAVAHRDMLADFTDNNVERLIREEADAAEAQGWLDLIAMGAGK